MFIFVSFFDGLKYGYVMMNEIEEIVGYCFGLGMFYGVFVCFEKVEFICVFVGEGCCVFYELIDVGC